MTTYILKFIAAFLCTFISGVFFRGIALRTGLLDRPVEQRKSHEGAVPLLGGAAVFAGVMAGMGVCFRCPGNISVLLICGAMIFILNLIDDAVGLSARIRLFVEISVSLVMIFLADARISFMPSGLAGDSAEILITVIWFVGMTNAVNYMDGLDGLASGITAIAAAFFAGMLFYTRQPQLASVALVLVASSIAFMPYNFSKNKKMFLGDAGSTFMGFMLAGIGVMGHWATYDTVRLTAPVLVLGVPIFDMTFTTVMRTLEGKIHNLSEWMHYADRDHFHHSLLDIGFRPRRAVYFIWLVCVILGLSGLLVRKNMNIEAMVALFQAILIFWMVGLLIVMGRRKHNGKEKICE